MKFEVDIHGQTVELTTKMKHIQRIEAEFKEPIARTLVTLEEMPVTTVATIVKIICGVDLFKYDFMPANLEEVLTTLIESIAFCMNGGKLPEKNESSPVSPQS